MFVWYLSGVFLVFAVVGGKCEQYSEQLILRPVAGGKVYAHFHHRLFVPTTLEQPYKPGSASSRHHDLFPYSLLSVLQELSVQEVHLSLAKGTWDYREWGLPLRDTPSYAQISAWFHHSNEKPEEAWRELITRLSSQFCASLDVISLKETGSPRWSYKPLLARDGQTAARGYLAHMADEAICTENLVSWLKLLPCGRARGLGALLQAKRIFDSHFVALALDFQFSCSDLSNCSSTTGMELTLNTMVVLNPPRLHDGELSWSISSLLGSALATHCPLSDSSQVVLEGTAFRVPNSKPSPSLPQSGQLVCLNDQLELVPLGNVSDAPNCDLLYLTYDVVQEVERLKNSTRKAVPIGMQYPKGFEGPLPVASGFDAFQVKRSLRGFGAHGGLSITLINRLPVSVPAVYLDLIPWFVRLFWHSLRIKSTSLDRPDEPARVLKPLDWHYEPARDRARPHHLELVLDLPPRSSIHISLSFELAFLRWSEFPPDPSHGLTLPPATVTFYPAGERSTLSRLVPAFLGHRLSLNDSLGSELRLAERHRPLRLHTSALLVPMPTPDFSMPFNVICLVSTLASLAFGPLYNLTTRRVQPSLKTSKPSGDTKKRKRFWLF